MGMVLIETVEVGAGGASSIEFTSIPQDGVDLVVRMSIRPDVGSSIHNLIFNSDSTTGNYSSKMLTGNGATVYAYSLTNNMVLTVYSVDTANTFSNGEILVANYGSTSQYKSVSLEHANENNGTYVTGVGITAGIWNNTSAITSLKLECNGGNWIQFSTASLYKITAD